MRRDWTYSEGCGCQVTFFAESGFKTSRMTPGETCNRHTTFYQISEREQLQIRAREALEDFDRTVATMLPDRDSPHWFTTGR